MPLLKNIYAGWMKFAGFIGHINSTIILSILFFVFIGNYSVIFKTIGLFKKIGSRADLRPGWKQKKYTEPTLKIMERQF